MVAMEPQPPDQMQQAAASELLRRLKKNRFTVTRSGWYCEMHRPPIFRIATPEIRCAKSRTIRAIRQAQKGIEPEIAVQVAETAIPRVVTKPATRARV